MQSFVEVLVAVDVAVVAVELQSGGVELRLQRRLLARLCTDLALQMTQRLLVRLAQLNTGRKELYKEERKKVARNWIYIIARI